MNKYNNITEKQRKFYNYALTAIVGHHLTIKDVESVCELLVNDMKEAAILNHTEDDPRPLDEYI